MAQWGEINAAPPTSTISDSGRAKSAAATSSRAAVSSRIEYAVDEWLPGEADMAHDEHLGQRSTRSAPSTISSTSLARLRRARSHVHTYDRHGRKGHRTDCRSNRRKGLARSWRMPERVRGAGASPCHWVSASRRAKTAVRTKRCGRNESCPKYSRIGRRSTMSFGSGAPFCQRSAPI